MNNLICFIMGHVEDGDFHNYTDCHRCSYPMTTYGYPVEGVPRSLNLYIRLRCFISMKKMKIQEKFRIQFGRYISSDDIPF